MICVLDQLCKGLTLFVCENELLNRRAADAVFSGQFWDELSQCFISKES